MQKIVATNWKYDETTAKFTLLAQLENGEQVEIDVSKDAMSQMIGTVIPNEEKRIAELLNQIYNIVQKRLLTTDKIAEEFEELKDEAEDIKKEYDKCQNKTDKLICDGKLKAVDTKRATVDKKRHLVKLLMQEEAQLRTRLFKLKRGIEE